MSVRAGDCNQAVPPSLADGEATLREYVSWQWQSTSAASLTSRRPSVRPSRRPRRPTRRTSRASTFVLKKFCSGGTGAGCLPASSVQPADSRRLLEEKAKNEAHVHPSREESHSCS